MSLPTLGSPHNIVLCALYEYIIWYQCDYMFTLVTTLENQQEVNNPIRGLVISAQRLHKAP